MKVLCAQTYIPIRAAASDTSEMVSQLLFGETCQVMEEAGRWVRVRCDFDGYEGWIFRPSLILLSDEQHSQLTRMRKSIVNAPNLLAHDLKFKQSLYITAGSYVYELNFNTQTFWLLDRQYAYREPIPQISQSYSPSRIIIETALQMVNVPYLWGGRSTFGIDCSGLVQTCFKIAGIALPRDAAQQAQLGDKVASIDDIRPADLAFFKNDQGRIIHVGILLSPHQIIHASNFVQVNNFDQHGILHPGKTGYSHRLAFIKRII
ncbi:MAG: NlpC/P60 family protein [Bacteroidales bacterium]